MLEHERDALAKISRAVAESGMALGTAGNVSARHGDLVAITPAGAALATVSGNDISVVDLDGSSLTGPPPSSELPLHLGAYHRRQAGAVIHAHAPASTALGCVLDELPAIHYQIVALGGPVRVARFATPGTHELAELTLDALQDRFAVLMANHGALCIGDDLTTALDRTRLLEWACALYIQAATLGPPRALTEAQLDAVRDELTRRGYGAPLATSGP